jgi:DNA-binding FadR family transcriptional regulator
MSERVRSPLASLSALLVTRCRNFVRRIFTAIQHGHERKAAREAERHLGLSGQKLTDEMERKMMERLTRNRNFQP